MSERWENHAHLNRVCVKILLQERFLHRKTQAAPPCHHNHHRYTSGNPTLIKVHWKWYSETASEWRLFFKPFQRDSTAIFQ